MNRLFEQQLVSQMMNGGIFGSSSGVLWLQLVIFLILVGIILFRKEAIIRVQSFRFAFVLLATSFILPAIVNVGSFVVMYYTEMLTTTGGRNSTTLMGQLMSILPSINRSMPAVFVGCAIVSVSRALVPGFLPPPPPSKRSFGPGKISEPEDEMEFE